MIKLLNRFFVSSKKSKSVKKRNCEKVSQKIVPRKKTMSAEPEHQEDNTCVVTTIPEKKLYVLRKNGQYVVRIRDNNCNFTELREQATFMDIDTAETMLAKMPKKLKGFQCVSKEKVLSEPIQIQRRSFTSKERNDVYASTQGHCALCGEFVRFDEFTVDHIIPLSKQGTNELTNLQPTCTICNRLKQDILPKDFQIKIMEIAMYQIEKQYGIQIRNDIEKILKLQ